MRPTSRSATAPGGQQRGQVGKGDLTVTVKIFRKPGSTRVEVDTNPFGAGFPWSFNVLDVTLPEVDQPGLSGVGGPATSYQQYAGDVSPAFAYGKSYQTGDGLETFSAGLDDFYATPIDVNTLIGPELTGGAFNQYVVFEFRYVACDVYYDGGKLVYGDCTPGGNAGAELVAPYTDVSFADLLDMLDKWGPCTEELAGGAPPAGTLAALAFGSAHSG